MSSSSARELRTAILDIDGTLVDSNYQHTLAWFRAFRQHDVTVPVWRIHREIGKGGDQLVEALAGEEVEERCGEDIRAAEGVLYQELIGEVVALEEARELIVDLVDRGLSVVLASSAKEHEVEHYLDLLDARDLAQAWTSSADVQATKPEPDLVQAALERSAGEPAVMIGDSVWDCVAAKRAGVSTLAVLTGGFSEQELREAGARDVFESILELRQRLDESLGA
ncbi:MAG TPA: HAD family hydrolase [Solirubrobacteraceae bacterium]|nr:HAD family hydrolase [Solirubrobacteraceae bacterium]